MLYGLAILLSGIFSTEPFIEGIPYSLQEAQLHTICATGAGLMLMLATLLYALTDAPPRRRIVHWVALALITLVSFAFGALPAIGGMLQRLLWVLGFAWLAYLGTGGTHNGRRTPLTAINCGPPVRVISEIRAGQRPAPTRSVAMGGHSP